MPAAGCGLAHGMGVCLARGGRVGKRITRARPQAHAVELDPLPSPRLPVEVLLSRHRAIFVHAVRSKEDAGCRGALAQPARGPPAPATCLRSGSARPQNLETTWARWTARAAVQACTPPAAQSS